MRRHLVLAALLLAAACATVRDTPPADGIAVEATPVALDPRDPARDRVGTLRYVGGLILRSRDPRFGGLSGLRVRDDGWALAVTDAGHWVGFRLVERDGRPVAVADPVIAPLLDAGGKPPDSKSAGDAESVELLADGTAFVTFEQDHRIQRYGGIDPAAPGTLAAAATDVGRPAASAGWSGNDGMEAFAVLAPDTDVLFVEGAGADGTHPAILSFDGHAIAFRYRPPTGFAPTDAVALDEGRVLVLHRAFSPASGAAAMLGVVTIDGIRAGTIVTPVELARLAPPLTVDNMEGLALRRAGGRIWVHVVSDDNFSPLQRTLLLTFELTIP